MKGFSITASDVVHRVDRIGNPPKQSFFGETV